jgi:hypothetical protein
MILKNLSINIFKVPRTTTFIVPQNELCNAINHHIVKNKIKK